jgi:hypothetical protein
VNGIEKGSGLFAQALATAAPDPLVGRADVNYRLKVGIGQPEDFIGVLGELPKACFAFTQLLFRPPAFGDVNAHRFPFPEPIYRWWPTKEAVLLEAFFEAAGEMLPFRQDKSPLARLRKHSSEAARFLKSERGRVMARLIMAIQEDDELQRGFLHIYPVGQLLMP